MFPPRHDTRFVPTFRASMCFNLSGSEVSSSSSSSPDVSSRTGLPPNFLIGVSLVIGFTLMFVVDQIGTYCSIHDPQTGMSNSTSVTATLGLVIHAATDGIALGAAVASSQVSVQVIVFFAVILHKAPAAFGLVTFLMHAGVQRRVVQKHLLAFSAAAPVLAITTYFILHATGGASWPSAVGIGMLFSAGTFLYVAMVHVLPEINSRGHHHPNGMQQHSGTPAYQQGGLGILESLLLISGTALPTLLTLGLHDD
ncbi:zinc transporter ZIP9 isoform X2 [Engraulis encrasicolus]|uniref:zinc transporter ZIP9 isoform X2 n=1 Tax=Engraulis encrasicolus TaxID=184585 RepID=UPI002FD4C3EE